MVLRLFGLKIAVLRLFGLFIVTLSIADGSRCHFLLSHLGRIVVGVSF